MAGRRRRGFTHWISRAANLPEKLSEEELQECYRKLRETGDRSAAERIIMGHVRLGLSKVAEFAVRSPNKIDEMVSIVLEVLTEGCGRIAAGAIDHHEGSPNVTGYLMSMVRGRLTRFVTGDGTLRISLETYKRMLSKNKGIPQVVIFDGSDLISRQVQQKARWDRDDLREMIDSAISTVQKGLKTDRSDLVRRVIELRVEGLKDPDIGERLDLTGRRIQQIRAAVGKVLIGSL